LASALYCGRNVVSMAERIQQRDLRHLLADLAVVRRGVAAAEPTLHRQSAARPRTHVHVDAIEALILVAVAVRVGNVVARHAGERRRVEVVDRTNLVAAAVGQARIARRGDREPVEVLRPDREVVSHRESEELAVEEADLDRHQRQHFVLQ
jgi:hypothetical protein